MDTQPGNAVPRAPLDFEAAGPFPWRRAVWSIVGVLVPLAIDWLRRALESQSTPAPTVDTQQNPPS